jgi:hypothetical protein
MHYYLRRQQCIQGGIDIHTLNDLLQMPDFSQMSTGQILQEPPIVDHLQCFAFLRCMPECLSKELYSEFEDSNTQLPGDVRMLDDLQFWIPLHELTILAICKNRTAEFGPSLQL